MYATKRLSELNATVDQAGLQLLPEGPSSGYIVVKEDDPNKGKSTCCWVFHCDPRVRDLPFPQNKILKVQFLQNIGQSFIVHTEEVLFLPVINLPLSANRYHAVVAKGKYKGLVHTCSKKEDMITRCFCQHIKDVKPKAFDHRDIYQQIEIIPHKGNFTAKSAAYDGFPPWIFRQKYWALYENNTEKYQLLEAFGLNNAIRSNFLKLPLASNVLIGKWYCPFIFVKEGQELKNQMERTTFYEVTVEQFWQEAYSGIEKKRVLLRGKEKMTEEMEPSDGFAWFRKTADSEEERIGLSLALWERIEWEENREGCFVQEVKVGCFVLVERFAFKGLD